MRRGGARVKRATLVLSFDYERGFAGEDARLADDGLERVLSELGRRGLKATFNCVAKIVEAAPQRIRAIAASGHEVSCHGYAHESPRDLADGELGAMVRRCIDLFAAVGVRPIGFRSPQSHWDERLMRALAANGFGYSAERDRKNGPYVMVSEPRRLVRMPIATDDWDYVRPGGTGGSVQAKHAGLVRAAARLNRFLAIGYHPWLLASDSGRQRDWERTVDEAISLGVRIGTFAEFLADGV